LHSLIGMSGSGKSTLLQHLNALIRPQSGTVRVGAFDLSDQDLDTRALRRLVSLAFQQPEDQIFEQYVGDEIAYGPRNLGYQGKLASIVEEAMRAVGLDFIRYKDRLTSELSGGERRKVALASILAVRANILLLDEPLAGLDPQSRQQVIHLLKTLHQAGKTLIISTHQYEELGSTCNAISLLHQGKNILDGSPQFVFSQQEILSTADIMPPLHTRIARVLREKGWPIEQAITDQNGLVLALDRATRGVA